MNLTKAFDSAHVLGGTEEGAMLCKYSCLSYLFCQYWQYSDNEGCWVEDPAARDVRYPLVADNISLVQGTKEANAIRGEFIQHVCDAGPSAPGSESDSQAGGSSQQAPTSRGSINIGKEQESEEQSGGGSSNGSSNGWGVFLVILLLFCCLAALT